MALPSSVSFASFFSAKHQDVVSMGVSIDTWCPNPNFYLGRAVSWSAYDGVGFVPVPVQVREEEAVPPPAASPTPSKKVRWWQRALAFCCCCYEVDF